jgi:hypothetical protein
MIARMEESSPPGVSSSMTTAAYPSRSARSISSLTYSCVTGFMSFSNSTTRTRDGAVAAVADAGTSGTQTAKRARNARKRNVFTVVS